MEAEAHSSVKQSALTTGRDENARMKTLAVVNLFGSVPVFEVMFLCLLDYRFVDEFEVGEKM